MRTYAVVLLAALREVLFIARNAAHFLIARYERLVTDRLLAHHAQEAFLVPRFATIFVFLHAYGGDTNKQ
jgi:hypothetical protein